MSAIVIRSARTVPLTAVCSTFRATFHYTIQPQASNQGSRQVHAGLSRSATSGRLFGESKADHRLVRSVSTCHTRDETGSQLDSDQRATGLRCARKSTIRSAIKSLKNYLFKQLECVLLKFFLWSLW